MKLLHWVRGLILVAVVTAAVIPGAPITAQGDIRLVFADDFTANVSKWVAVTGTYTQLDVGSGRLQLGIDQAGQAGWTVPQATVPYDADIEVKVTPIAPNSNGAWNYALIFRSNRADINGSFYHFGINGTGGWEFRYRPDNYESYTANIRSGKISNFDPMQPATMKVSARGTKITLYVNGKVIADFEDTAIEHDPNVETYIGLMAGTYANASNNVVEFRDLRVYEPIPTATSGAAFVETFAPENVNKWLVSKTAESEARISTTGSLAISVYKENIIRWSYPQAKTFPADVDVTVTVTPVTIDRTGAWSYGIGVRGYKDGSDLMFLLFEVRGTGEFTFTRQRGGNVEETLIGLTTIDGFDSGAVVRLRVVARGNNFKLYLNDDLVGTVNYTDESEENEYFVILTGGTFAGLDNFNVYFSDLTVQ